MSYMIGIDVSTTATKALLVIQFRKDVYENDEYYKAHVRQERAGKVFDPLEKLGVCLA